MKTDVASESPAIYAAKAAARGTSVLLHGVSRETCDRLVRETGEGNEARFLYDRGEFEIRGAIDHRVILRGVSWETYERLVEETGEERKTRFAYDDGELEMMAPHYPHEGANRKFEHLIMVLAQEFGIGFSPAGMMTCKSTVFKKGIEPDSCFYIQNVDAIGSEIDLKKDPPPDLMIEVDISRKSLNKLKICRALGVPEHWRFNGHRMEIRVLRDGDYIEVDESAAFPGVPLKEALPRFIEPRKGMNCVKMADEFREWLQHYLRSSRKTRSEKKRS